MQELLAVGSQLYYSSSGRERGGTESAYLQIKENIQIPTTLDELGKTVLGPRPPDPRVVLLALRVPNACVGSVRQGLSTSRALLLALVAAAVNL